MIVSIYVDDIVVTNSQKLLQNLKADMMGKYEMIDLGLLHHFLGIRIMQIETSIFIH